jgi:hypothetical protein
MILNAAKTLATLYKQYLLNAIVQEEQKDIVEEDKK